MLNITSIALRKSTEDYDSSQYQTSFCKLDAEDIAVQVQLLDVKLYN
jgi:hypothetical protein